MGKFGELGESCMFHQTQFSQIIGILIVKIYPFAELFFTNYTFNLAIWLALTLI